MLPDGGCRLADRLVCEEIETVDKYRFPRLLWCHLSGGQGSPGMEPERRLSCEHDSGRPASRPVCHPCLRESVKSWGLGGEAPIMKWLLPFPPRTSDRRPRRPSVGRRPFATRGSVAEAFAADSPESPDPVLEA